MLNEKEIKIARKTQYQQQHIEKRQKRLISDSSALGHNAVQELMKVCFKRLSETPAASLILTSLLSGRAFESLLENISFKQVDKDGKEYPCLDINLNYGSERWLVISDEITNDYNKDITISLPSFLTEGLKKAMGNEAVIEEAQTLIKSLNCGSRYFTETKIASFIDYKRFDYSISSAELTIIKNLDLKYCVNAQYGQMNIGVIQSKLNDFIDTTLRNFSHNIEIQFPLIIDNRSFGSHYTPSDNDVSSLFNEVIDSIKHSSNRSPEKVKEQFNLVTIFVAMYISIVTMHRAEREVYENFSHFNLVSGYLIVDDKIESERIVGLSGKSVTVLKQYLDFIQRNLACYSMLSFSIALTLNNLSEQKEKTFYLFDEQGQLVPFTFQLALKYMSARNPTLSTLKENFLRHWVSSKLYELDISRDLVAQIMGHSNESEFRNPFSSCSLFKLTEIAETIQEKIIDEKLKVPALGELL